MFRNALSKIAGFFKNDHSAQIAAVKPAIVYYLKYFENGHILKAKEVRDRDGNIVSDEHKIPFMKPERVRSIDFDEKTQHFSVRTRMDIGATKTKRAQQIPIIRNISFLDCLELMLDDEIKLIQDNITQLITPNADGKHPDLEKWVNRIHGKKSKNKLSLPQQNEESKEAHGEEPPDITEIRNSLIAELTELHINLGELKSEGKGEKKEEKDHAVEKNNHAMKVLEKHIKLSKISRLFRLKIFEMRGEKVKSVVVTTLADGDSIENEQDDSTNRMASGLPSETGNEETTGEDKADLAEKTLIDLPHYAIDIANFSNMSAPEFEELSPTDHDAVDRGAYDFPIVTYLFQALIYIYLASEASKQHDAALRRRLMIAHFTVAAIAVGSSFLSVLFRYSVGALGTEFALTLVPPVLAGITLIPILAALLMHIYMYGKLKAKESKLLQDIEKIQAEHMLAESTLALTNNEVDKALRQREITRLDLVLAHYHHHAAEIKQMKFDFKMSMGTSAFNIAAAIMLIISTAVGNIFGLMVAALVIGGIVTVLPLVRKFFKGFLNLPTSFSIPIDPNEFKVGSDMNSEHKQMYSSIIMTPRGDQKRLPFANDGSVISSSITPSGKRTKSPSPPPLEPIELGSLAAVPSFAGPPTNGSTTPPDYVSNDKQGFVYSV